MGKGWKYFVTVAVAISMLLSIIGCANLPELTQENIQKIQTALGASFEGYDAATEFPPPRGITAQEGASFTISWFTYNYPNDVSPAITVNGSFVISTLPSRSR